MHDAIERLAITKITDSKARKEVSPGEYEGVFDARIAFKLKVGEDYKQVVSQAVPWQRIALYALSKLNGVSLEAAVAEALVADIDEAHDDLADRCKAVVSELTESVTKTCAGKVTGTVAIESIVPAALADHASEAA